MYNYFVLPLKLTQYCKYLYSNKKKSKHSLEGEKKRRHSVGMHWTPLDQIK